MSQKLKLNELFTIFLCAQCALQGSHEGVKRCRRHEKYYVIFLYLYI